jgi:hypothetical protein
MFGQWDEAMQAVSRAMGFAGTVSNADFRQKDPAGPVHLSYDYTRPSFGDWDSHRILPLFPVTGRTTTPPTPRQSVWKLAKPTFRRR